MKHFDFVWQRKLCYDSHSPELELDFILSFLMEIIQPTIIDWKLQVSAAQKSR